LAIIELQRGDAKAALEAAKNEPEGVWREIALAMALQAGKDRAAADAALANLIADYGDVAAYQVAQVQALRNDADATFEWLERARANRDPGVGNTMIDPLVMRYKEDPRLAAFCETVGLPPPHRKPDEGPLTRMFDTSPQLDCNGRILRLDVPQVMGIVNVTPGFVFGWRRARRRGGPRSRMRCSWWRRAPTCWTSAANRPGPAPKKSRSRKNCAGSSR
jgi:hypothetical protein